MRGDKDSNFVIRGATKTEGSDAGKARDWVLDSADANSCARWLERIKAVIGTPVDIE